MRISLLPVVRCCAPMLLAAGCAGGSAGAESDSATAGNATPNPMAAASFMASEYALQRAERWGLIRQQGGVTIEVGDLDNYERVVGLENQYAERMLAGLGQAATHADSLRIKYGIQFEPRRSAIAETSVNADHFVEVDVMVDTLMMERAAAQGAAPGAGTLWARQPAPLRAELATRAPRLEWLRTRRRQITASAEQIPGPRKD